MTIKAPSNSMNRDNNSTTQGKLSLKVLLVTLLAHFEQHSFSFALAPLLVLVKSDLSLSLTQIGIIGASPLFTLITFQVVCGLLADRYGSRVLLVGGTGFSAFAMFLVSISNGFYSLILAQLLLGIGLSSYHPAGIRLVTRMVSPEHKGKAISLQGVGGIMGSAFTPVIAVTLAEALNGWRSALRVLAWVGVAATIIEFLLLLSFVEKDRPQQKDVPDSFPHSQVRVALKPIFVSFGFGSILLFSFFREAVFRNVSYFVPLFFEDIGYTIIQAGFISSLLLGIGALAQLCGGVLSDIFSTSRQRYLIVGCTGLASIFLYLLANAVKGPWLLVFTILFGFTYFMTVPFLLLIVSNFAPDEAQGITFAILFSSMGLFAAFSSVLFGVIGENFGLRMSMNFLAISTGIAAFAALLLPRSSNRKKSPSNI